MWYIFCQYICCLVTGTYQCTVSCARHVLGTLSRATFLHTKLRTAHQEKNAPGKKILSLHGVNCIIFRYKQAAMSLSCPF